MQTNANETELAHSKSYRSLVISMLVLVYTFNFIDRQILGILAEPHKESL